MLKALKDYEKYTRTYRIHIQGQVQGVGFRPTVYRVAKNLGIFGHIANSPQGALLEIQGRKEKINLFLKEISNSIPPNAKITNIQTQLIQPKLFKNFSIKKSKTGHKISVDIPPDLSICNNCLKELLDANDRRYSYPFINCTNCGPRFTIIKQPPYDRNKTTMSKFKMCPSCKKEYETPFDRRFHAQPNACKICGPNIKLLTNKIDCAAKQTESIANTIKLLKNGKIIAIKSLGGYHLACDAENIQAILNLRNRKTRPHKPFAIMVPDIETAKELCFVDSEEEKLLTSIIRPIVLLRKRKHETNPFTSLSLPDPRLQHSRACLIGQSRLENKSSNFSCFKKLNLIAPNNAYLGIMLPYTPLHYLLFSKKFSSKKSSLSSLIMTSGNLQDEPICSTEKEAYSKLCSIADYFLINNRDINNKCDDSIVLGLDKKMPVVIRRSRGYVPQPIKINRDLHKAPNILAVGAELKNTFCLTRNNNAYLSQYIGDLNNHESLEFYKKSIKLFQTFLKVKPEIIVCDLHPNYMSSIYAHKLKSKNKFLKLLPVQHHFAHIASVLAEKNINSPVIGFAFDGTGYGLDGKIWGGECILYKNNNFERLAHFEYFPLPGGDIAAKQIWRLAISVLNKAGINEIPTPIKKNYPYKQIRNIIHKNINSPECSSVGRIFDAVASIIGIRNEVTFEAQAAIELESIALHLSVKKGYNFNIKWGTPSKIILTQTFKEIWKDVKSKTRPEIISSKFHFTISNIIVNLAVYHRKIYKTNDIVLSGGVFQNRLLLSLAVNKLEENNFNVHFNTTVPANDGGISLGQAWIAMGGGTVFRSSDVSCLGSDLNSITGLTPNR